MPDGDVFTRKVARQWQNLAAALRDGLAVDECALRIEDSIAADLRKLGGFARPGLEDLLRDGGAEEGDVVTRLGDLVHSQVFERVMPLLVAKGTFTSRDQAQRFMALCIATTRMDMLARSLMSHPDGRGLQRPRRQRSLTVDLLNEPASLGQRA